MADSGETNGDMPDMSNDANGGVLTVVVPPTRRGWSIHRQLLKLKDISFDKADPPLLQPIAEDHVLLDDVEPDVFNLFFMWLSGLPLPAVQPAGETLSLNPSGPEVPQAQSVSANHPRAGPSQPSTPNQFSVAATADKAQAATITDKVVITASTGATTTDEKTLAATRKDISRPIKRQDTESPIPPSITSGKAASAPDKRTLAATPDGSERSMKRQKTELSASQPQANTPTSSIKEAQGLSRPVDAYNTIPNEMKQERLLKLALLCERFQWDTCANNALEAYRAGEVLMGRKNPRPDHVAIAMASVEPRRRKNTPATLFMLEYVVVYGMVWGGLGKFLHLLKKHDVFLNVLLKQLSGQQHTIQGLFTERSDEGVCEATATISDGPLKNKVRHMHGSVLYKIGRCPECETWTEALQAHSPQG